MTNTAAHQPTPTPAPTSRVAIGAELSTVLCLTLLLTTTVPGKASYQVFLGAYLLSYALLVRHARRNRGPVALSLIPVALYVGLAADAWPARLGVLGASLALLVVGHTRR